MDDSGGHGDLCVGSRRPLPWCSKGLAQTFGVPWVPSVLGADASVLGAPGGEPCVCLARALPCPAGVGLCRGLVGNSPFSGKTGPP